MANNALILLIAFPIVGTIVAGLMKPGAMVRSWTLIVSAVTFVASVIVACSVLSGNTLEWSHDRFNLETIGFGVKLAADGISIWLVLLTTLITPLVVLSVSKDIGEQPNGHWYYAWILLLMAALNGTFLAADGLLFYFFFELTLIPTLLMIGIWGGPERREAAGKFFIYTFAGSVFLLISLIYVAAQAGSFEIAKLVEAGQYKLSATELCWVGAGLLVGFLIKTPVFPLHTWQPLAYAESPNGATVLMASVMSKLGTYGLIRLTIPIAFTTAGHNQTVLCIVAVLCLISIVYGGLIAWVQKDMVRLMAYSSLSHLGLCVLAIFATSTLSLQGAVMYMLAHGLSTAAILLVIDMIARRTGTRNIDEISGLFAKMPVLSTLLVLFVMASIGLPITSGFVGEFLSLQGVMNHYGLGVTVIAATGMVLGAIYMLHMIAKVGFGPLKAPEGAELKDICGREIGALLPLATAVLVVGITPTPILDSFKNDVATIAAEWKPKADTNAGPKSESDFFGQ